MEEISPQQVLEKSPEYLSSSHDASLKKAYEALGLDYEALKMSKLYVSEVSHTKDEMNLDIADQYQQNENA